MFQLDGQGCRFDIVHLVATDENIIQLLGYTAIIIRTLYKQRGIAQSMLR